MRELSYYRSRITYYQQIVEVLVVKNLKVRYKNSAIGFLWALINPIMMLLVFTIIFKKVVGPMPNYELYVTCGLVFWNFFITSSGQMINSIWQMGPILKSTNLPPSIFPISILGSNFVNFFLTFIVFFIFMLFVGLVPSWKLLLLLPYTVLFIMFTYGFSIILASLNVFFRDVEMFWTTITPILFYATPVVYQVTPELKKYMRFNPFHHFMVLIRDILYESQKGILDIEPSHYLIPTFLAFFTLGLGLYVYNTFRRGFISNF